MPQIFSPFLLWGLNVDIPVNIPNRFSIDASLLIGELVATAAIWSRFLVQQVLSQSSS
jgi:hypothetical protein